MKVLIITRSPWDNSNSEGNTLTNLFSGWESDDIANLYCRVAYPNNTVCHKYFSISEKKMFKSIFKKKYRTGNAFNWDSKSKILNPESSNDVENENILYSFFRRNSFVLALWARELLWKLGKWKSSDLEQFIIDFKPDVIFTLCPYNNYIHRILWYIKEKTNAKVVLFHVDDYLTTNNLIGSLLKKIDRIWYSRTVRKSAMRADLNYCISHKQQEEYYNLINRDMKLLYKGANFNGEPLIKEVSNKKTIRIVYAGNILYGRWKTLGMLAKTIHEINKGNNYFELLIYSQYEPSSEAINEMVIEGASRFMGSVPPEKVDNLLSASDIVLHIESFDVEERLKTRLSFSTKIVDMLHSSSCILAIGWKEAASIDYLIKNEAALVATNEKELRDKLEEIIKSPSIISEYATKAWECGKRNHEINVIQENLYKDLFGLIEI